MLIRVNASAAPAMESEFALLNADDFASISDFVSISSRGLSAWLYNGLHCAPLELPARPADPIIKNSIADGANKNVFLIDGIAKDSFYAGSISVNGDVLCLNAINGKISLRLEGEGNRASIQQWT